MANTEEERILDIKVRYDDAIKAIASYKEKIDSLKAAEKELGKEVRSGQITMGEYNKTVAANDAVMTQYKENMRVLKKELQNNLRQEQEMQGSLKQLRAELSNATKAYDELSRAERNGAKGKELQQHIKDITKELKGAEEATDRFYRNVGNYKNSIAEALTGNNQFASSLLKMAQDGGGVKGLFTNIIGSVKAFGTALMGLLSNPVFLGIAGIAGAGAAFKWWWGYNEGLMKASKLTTAFTGMHGEEMKTYRNEVQAVSDAFGLDFSETLKTVNALVQNYGISWQDALTKVKDGLLMGGSILPEYSQFIQQYAGAFKDLGINANQLVGIMTSIGKSGINVNTALQSINRGGYNLQKMSATLSKDLKAAGIDADDLSKRIQSGQISTIGAMQEVTKKLEEQGVTSKNTAVVMQDLFGKGAINLGSQFLKVLNGMGTGIDQIKSKASETQKIRDKTIQKQAELNSTISAMFDMTGGGFEKMKAQMKYIAVNSLLAIAKAVVRVINYFIDWYNESMVVRYIIQAIVTDFKMVWNTVKVVFNLIIDAVKSVGRQLKGMADIIEGIVTLSWDKIKQGFSTIGSNFGKTLKEGFADVKAYAASTVGDMIDGMNNVINNKKVKHIEVPVSVGGVGATSGSPASGGGSGSTTTKGSGKSTSSSKTGKNNSDKTAQQQAKVEEEEVRKAEDLLNQLITDAYERQRETIITSYDRRIEDIKKKLTTEKNLTVNTITALNSQVKSLEELKNRDLEKLDNEHSEKQIRAEQEKIANYLTTVQKGTAQSYDMRYKQLENEQRLAEINAEKSYTDETERNEQLLSIRAAYKEKFEKLDNDYDNELLQNIKDQFSAKISEAWNNQLEQLQLQAQEAQAIYDAAYQQQGESTEAFLARKEQLYADWQQKKEALDDKEVEMEKTKWTTITDMMGSVSDAFEALGETSKGFAKLSKVIALAQIAINMGEALTSGWATASKVQPYPAMVIAQAQVVASVLAQMASAIKIVKSAKFAHGGAVTGAGTGTSDSIPARLSNGESVMTATATSLFAPALSAFNQLGGGVPIVVSSPQQQMGEEFIAAAVARGMAMAPRPVVSVEEIDDTSNRVQTIENLSTL